MSKVATKIPEAVMEQLEEVCARDMIAEMHFEDDSNRLCIARMRLLRIEDDELHVGAPQCIGRSLKIQALQRVVIYFMQNGVHYGFKSVVKRAITKVDLNAQKRIVGMKLRLPSAIVEQQRRQDFRLSLAGQVLPVTFHRCQTDDSPLVPIDADRFQGRVADISSSGMCIHFDVVPRARFALWERLYVFFGLPSYSARFVLPVEVRHLRRIAESRVLTMGVLFADSDDLAIKRELNRVHQFVVNEERRQIRSRGPTRIR